MLITITAIGSGGALGAISRYGVSIAATHISSSGFPWGTLIVNVTGSFLIGLLITVFALFWQPSETWRLFFITGFLGSFTTFSTFSLDVVTLYHRGETLFAFLYGSISITLSIGALILGMILARSFSS